MEQLYNYSLDSGVARAILVPPPYPMVPVLQSQLLLLRCIKAIGPFSDALVDQRAFLLRQAAYNNMNIQKYRAIVLKEMEDKKKRRASETTTAQRAPAAKLMQEEEEPETGNYFHSFFLINNNFFLSLYFVHSKF